MVRLLPLANSPRRLDSSDAARKDVTMKHYLLAAILVLVLGVSTRLYAADGCTQSGGTPHCEGLECGDNGCDRLCGECVEGYQCLKGLCTLATQPEAEGDAGIVYPGELLETFPEVEADAGDDAGSGGSSFSCKAGGQPAANPLMTMLTLLIGLLGLRLRGFLRPQHDRPHKT